MLRDDERQELEAWRSRQAFAVLALLFAVIPAGVYLTVLAVLNPADFFASVQVILLPALIFWGWLLRLAPVRWRRAGRDLKAGIVDQCRGIAMVRERRGIGILAPSRQWLHVGTRQFELPSFWSEQVLPGLGYRVRFAPHSGAILSISREAAAEEAVKLPDGLELSSRDRALIRLIAEGLTDKDIARELNLSPTTVRTYNSELYSRLGIERRTQVRALAEAWGLTGEP